MSTKLILGLAATAIVAATAACDDDICRNRPTNMLNSEVFNAELETAIQSVLDEEYPGLDLNSLDLDAENTEAFEMGAGKIRIKKVLKKIAKKAGKVAENYGKNYVKGLVGAFEMAEEEIDAFQVAEEEEMEDVEDVEAFELNKFKFKKAVKKTAKGIVKKAKRAAENYAKNYAKGLIGAYELNEEDFQDVEDVEDVEADEEAFEMGAGKIRIKKILKKVGRAAEKAAKNYARERLGAYELEEEDVEDVEDVEDEAFEMGAGKIRIKKILKKVGRAAEKAAKNYARERLGAYELEEEDVEDVEDVEDEAFEMGAGKIRIKKALKKIAKKAGKVAENYGKNYVRGLIGAFEMAEEDFEVADEDMEAFEMDRMKFIDAVKGAVSNAKNAAVKSYKNITSIHKWRPWGKKITTTSAFEVSEDDVKVADEVTQVVEESKKKRTRRGKKGAKKGGKKRSGSDRMARRAKKAAKLARKSNRLAKKALRLVKKNRTEKK